MSLQFFSLSRTTDNIAKLSIQINDNGQHKITSAFLYELLEVIGSIHNEKLNGLIISSALSNVFLTGIDNKTLTTLATAEYTDKTKQVQKTMGFFSLGNQCCRQLEQLNCPTVAIISGQCTGAGIEIAMACDYRVLVDKHSTQVSYAEVNHGYHIGFGGINRLIQHIGLSATESFLLASQPYTPRQCISSGIATCLTESYKAQLTARYLIKTTSKPFYPKEQKAGVLHQLLPDKLANTINIITKISKTPSGLQKQVIDQVISTYQTFGTQHDALQEEVTTATSLLLPKATHNALYINQLIEQKRSQQEQHTAVVNTSLRIHIIGSGIMGKYLIRLCTLRGMVTSIYDKRTAALSSVLPDSKHYLSLRYADYPSRIQEVMDNIVIDQCNTGIKHADIIIEAIQENKDAKASLLLEIEKQAKPSAVILTTTSCLALEALTSNMQSPQRLLGCNVFHPALHNPVFPSVAELMVSASSNQSTGNSYMKALQFIQQLGFTAITVQSAPGYLTTRLIMAYLTQALMIHQAGVAISEIDAAARELGMKHAPFPLIDEIGLEECLRIQESLADYYGYDVSQLLMQKVEQGIKGKQSGEGFYKYKHGKRLPLLAGMILKQLPVNKDKNSIKKQLLESLINESRICLSQGVIKDASDVDLLSVAIVGFSAAKGGTLNYLSEQTL